MAITRNLTSTEQFC